MACMGGNGRGRYGEILQPCPICHVAYSTAYAYLERIFKGCTDLVMRFLYVDVNHPIQAAGAGCWLKDNSEPVKYAYFQSDNPKLPDRQDMFWFWDMLDVGHGYPSFYPVYHPHVRTASTTYLSRSRVIDESYYYWTLIGENFTLFPYPPEILGKKCLNYGSDWLFLYFDPRNHGNAYSSQRAPALRRRRRKRKWLRN